MFSGGRKAAHVFFLRRSGRIPDLEGWGVFIRRGRRHFRKRIDEIHLSRFGGLSRKGLRHGKNRRPTSGHVGGRWAARILDQVVEPDLRIGFFPIPLHLAALVTLPAGAGAVTLGFSFVLHVCVGVRRKACGGCQGVASRLAGRPCGRPSPRPRGRTAWNRGRRPGRSCRR
jgi:hypothetical protein